MYTYVYSIHSTHQINDNEKIKKLFAVKISVLELIYIFICNVYIYVYKYIEMTINSKYNCI